MVSGSVGGCTTPGAGGGEGSCPQSCRLFHAPRPLAELGLASSEGVGCSGAAHNGVTAPFEAHPAELRQGFFSQGRCFCVVYAD